MADDNNREAEELQECLSKLERTAKLIKEKKKLSNIILFAQRKLLPYIFLAGVTLGGITATYITAKVLKKAGYVSNIIHWQVVEEKKAIEEKLKNAESDIVNLEKAISDYEKQLDDAEEQLKRFSSVKKDNERLERETYLLKKTVKSIEKEKLNLNNEKRALIKKINELEETFFDYRRKIGQLSSENEESNKKITDLEENLAKLKETHSSFLNEYDRIKNRLESLISNYTNLKKRYGAECQEKEQLSEQIDGLEKKLTSEQEKLKAAETKINELTKENEENRSLLVEKEREFKKTEDKLHEFRVKYDELVDMITPKRKLNFFSEMGLDVFFKFEKRKSFGTVEIYNFIKGDAEYVDGDIAFFDISFSYFKEEFDNAYLEGKQFSLVPLSFTENTKLKAKMRYRLVPFGITWPKGKGEYYDDIINFKLVKDDTFTMGTYHMLKIRHNNFIVNFSMTKEYGHWKVLDKAPDAIYSDSYCYYDADKTKGDVTLILGKNFGIGGGFEYEKTVFDSIDLVRTSETVHINQHAQKKRTAIGRLVFSNLFRIGVSNVSLIAEGRWSHIPKEHYFLFDKENIGMSAAYELKIRLDGNRNKPVLEYGKGKASHAFELIIGYDENDGFYGGIGYGFKF